MIYIDEDDRKQCTDCCISCEKDKNICEAKKERIRWARRMIYKAKKEYEKSKVGD